MRAYTKPTMEVQRFIVETAVADGCSSQQTGTQTVYEPQTVTCVITGSETIFTAGTSGCAVAADVNSSHFVTYNGKLYYIWSAPKGEGSGDLNKLYPILDAAGIRYGNYGSAGGNNYWHAAPATSGLQAIYGFSY